MVCKSHARVFLPEQYLPAKPKLNRGIWKDLEEQCRLWALDNGSLLIVTGPVITGDMKRLGKTGLRYPKPFIRYCVIIRRKAIRVSDFFSRIGIIKIIRWNRWRYLSTAWRRQQVLTSSRLSPTIRKTKWKRRLIGAVGHFNAYIRKIIGGYTLKSGRNRNNRF